MTVRPRVRAARLVLGLALWLLQPATAGADWQIAPFLGLAFGGETNLADLDQATGRTRLAWGGDVTYLGPGLFGLEADIAYVPGFFETDRVFPLVTASGVTTVTGNLVLALPRSVTRESLRPFGTVGLGLIRPRFEDILGIFPSDRNLLGLSIGGGVVGFVTARTGLRWDVRYFKTVKGDDEASTIVGGTTRLSFWRGSMGLVIRY